LQPYIRKALTFIHGFGHSSGNPAIVKAMIDPAHAKGLKTTAEGVEATEQSELLRDLGCDQLQGYLMSKALPRQELEAH
jgi:EAL domain-containing protein (putative c-di-GMP-specific phosphodiesterase class I)